MTLKLKSSTNELWKGWNLAWFHNFAHIACAKRLRGLREKLDALHVQTRPSPSKYEGFGRKLICYKGISFFWTYLNSKLLCVFKMHHSKPHHQFSTLSDFIWYFSCIYWLAWYHHFTHIACAKKFEGLRRKLDALRVQNGQSLSKYHGFVRKLIC